MKNKITAMVVMLVIFVVFLIPSAAFGENDVPDLKAIYEEYCDSKWATLSGDGMSLTLDSNPSNISDFTEFEALFAIEDVNQALRLPESVYVQMGNTTVMQGVQTYERGSLIVTWSYHPDNGMEVLYSIKADSDQEFTKEDLKKVYEENCDPEWATLSGDGLSLSLDANPSNKDVYSVFAALFAIEKVNKALGIPESVYTQMGSNTAMQDVQTYEMGNLTVSWFYHPDNGMEVLYSIK